CSRAATCRTAATARPSRLLAPAAWRRWKWRNSWKTKDIDGELFWTTVERHYHRGTQGYTEETPRISEDSPLYSSVPPVVKVLFARATLASAWYPAASHKRFAAPVGVRSSGSSSNRAGCAWDRTWLSPARASPIPSAPCRPRLCYAAIDSRAARSRQRTDARALPGSAPHTPRAAASDSATSPNGRPRGSGQAGRPPWAPTDNAPTRRDRPNWSRGRATRQTAEIQRHQNSLSAFRAGKRPSPFLQASGRRKDCRPPAPRNPFPVRGRSRAGTAPQIFSIRPCTSRGIGFPP